MASVTKYQTVNQYDGNAKELGDLGEKMPIGNITSENKKNIINQNPIAFENALELAKFGKFNCYLIFICGIILSSSYVQSLSIGFVIPVAECEMKFTSTEKGALSGIIFVGIIVSSHFWGYLSDTIGRKAIIVPSLFATLLFSFLTSLSPNFWFLLIFRLINGLFLSASSAAVYAYIGEYHTAKYRGRAIMMASTIFGVGCILMPLFAFLVINQNWSFHIPLINVNYKPWRLFLVVCGFPGFAGALALTPLPESPKFLLGMGKQQETINVLKKMYHWNVGGGGGNNTTTNPILQISSIIEEQESINMRNRLANNRAGLLKSMWDQTVPLFKKPYLRTTLIASFMQFGSFICSCGMFMWFPNITNRVADYVGKHETDSNVQLCDILTYTRLNLTETNSILMMELSETNLNCVTKLDLSTYGYTFILEALYAVGFAVMVLVINLFGKFSLLVGLNILSGLSGILAIYVTIPHLAIYLYIILLLSGLVVPVINAATVDTYPTAIRGMGVCLSLMMGRFGGVFGTNMVAILIEDYCKLTFSIAGYTLLFCALLTLFIPNLISAGRKVKIHKELIEKKSLSEP